MRGPRRWKVRLALCVSLVALALAASACGVFQAPPPVPTATPSAANLFANPGFEDGPLPWSSLETDQWGAFAVSDGVAHGGGHSAEMQLEGDAAATGTHIIGAVQNVNASTFPEYVSGFYRVQQWRPTAPFQYLQFVVIVKGGDFGDDIDLHEIRFIIAGADREPFLLSNARFVFLSRAAPAMREWTYFGYPVRQAFQERWGKVPGRWDAIQVFFEVRYDSKTAGKATSAEAYFDDLYAGTQFDNPNRPAEP